MSKGNINYKYLKRRKSWFRRNLTLVIFIAVAVIAIAGAVTAGIMLYHYNKEKQDDNHGRNDEQTVISTEETTAAREVVWIDNKETESKEQEYIAPEGVYLPYFIKVNRAANCATVYGLTRMENTLYQSKHLQHHVEKQATKLLWVRIM